MADPRTSSGSRSVRGFPVRMESRSGQKTESGRTGHRDGMGRDGMGSRYRLPQPPDSPARTEQAEAAWTAVMADLEGILHPNAMSLWVGPMDFLGEYEGSLVIAARSEIARWAGNRYGRVIGDVCRRHGFRGALICEVTA